MNSKRSNVLARAPRHQSPRLSSLWASCWARIAVSFLLTVGGSAWLASCASTEEPPAVQDAGVPTDAEAVQSGCGDGVVDPGEACDGENLGDEDCASRGFEAGVLACDACAFDTSACFTCGDGERGEAEECDGAELGGQTCQGLGYLGGALACDVATCTFDITGCDTREILQNHDDNCLNTLGCSNDAGNMGNPQKMFECFRGVVIPPPFWLTEVSYGIGAGTPAPAALELEVYTWSGDGSPGSRIATVPLAVEDLALGDHALQLAEPVEIDASSFCVAFSGSEPADSFELTYTSTASPDGTSFLEAPVCGATVPADINTLLPGPGTWCIGAQVDKLLP